MRTLSVLAMVLIVPVACMAAGTQTQQVVPERSTVKLLLLRQKSVQQELELTPAAVEKIMAFTSSQAEAARKAIAKGPAVRKQAFERLEKQNKEFVASTLNAKQSKRLDQITLQFGALRQLTKPEVAKALDLTTEQKVKFKAMRIKARKELADLINAKDGKEKSEKLAELREKTRTKILELLTDEQKTTVREMAGAPFTGKIVFEEREPPKEK